MHCRNRVQYSSCLYWVELSFRIRCSTILGRIA
uniref:Uncharacterized protein n=1 Tax=Syphacia muris TaxID=451379 RepID=A0A0N5AC97_9BILA